MHEPPSSASARRLAAGFATLLVLTFGLIVLGALVRANDAGLACPDWPLCFGELLPRFDVKVAFEWSHRAIAGTVALCFAGRAGSPSRASNAAVSAAFLSVHSRAALDKRPDSVRWEAFVTFTVWSR